MGDKLKVYIDLDGTCINSIEKAIEHFNKIYETNQNKYSLKDYSMKSLYPKIKKEDIKSFFDSEELFEQLEFLEGFKETCSELIELIEIIFISKGTKENLLKKEHWLSYNYLFDYKFIPVEKENSNKSEYNFENSVLIEDLRENLKYCNAKYKILMRNYIDADYNKPIENLEELYVVNNWKEIKQVLLYILEK